MNAGLPSLDAPIADPAEVAAFLKTVPLAVDPKRFGGFVLGFPRRYLAVTPRADIVKHFALCESGASKPVTSALSPDGSLWKLSILCHERRLLFSRLAGSLLVHGLGIVEAEAFANSHGLVLDTFRLADLENRLSTADARREFQAFLERAASGDPAAVAKIEERAPVLPPNVRASLTARQDAHPKATHLRLECEDFPGLLYFASRAFASAGCEIEMAFVRTPGARADDEFYLTKDGGKLAEEDLRRIEASFARP